MPTVFAYPPPSSTTLANAFYDMCTLEMFVFSHKSGEHIDFHSAMAFTTQQRGRNDTDHHHMQMIAENEYVYIILLPIAFAFPSGSPGKVIECTYIRTQDKRADVDDDNTSTSN